MKEDKLQKEKDLNVKEPHFKMPSGDMTGDEFERRVKARVTQFYQEEGLI
ncbi:MAG: hypothetical protein LBG77_04120 [Dysgonamonadaceae bacterium]|jgi:hypothetical protein|nr:hypothetical protein [Dysgonamonadaceae bacterium]